MILKEITNTLSLVWCEKLSRISLLLIIFGSLLISIFFSIFVSFVIITSYLCGCVVSFCLVKYRFEVGFCLQRLTSLYHGHVTPKKTFSKTCNICDNTNCHRHTGSKYKEPWKNIRISKELNQALEDFFNKILENFITSWYCNVSEDSAFVNELKSSLRFIVSTILSRYFEVDLGRLIANKLIPCATRHIHDCLEIQRKAAKENIDLNAAAISYFGRRLHAAVTNSQNQLEYLRQLSAHLLPKLLTKSQLECRNFKLLIREILACWVLLPLVDIIADPNIINLLINLAANAKHKTSKHILRNPQKVEVLQNFSVQKNSAKVAALGCDLVKIFKSPEMLYSFMQFLKEEGPVNVLQFCLDVEEFNRKLLTPDLSKQDLENLYVDATQLCQLYLKPHSPDHIGCPEEIATSFEHLLQGGAPNIIKLRTSLPLYKAYDFAFNILESKWLPVFYHSNEFYKLACGAKITASYQKPSANRNKKVIGESQGTVSKISSGLYRIKGALRNQPIDGSIYQLETQTFEPPPTPLFIEKNIYRDLTAWRVSIEYAEHAVGPKPINIYHINVKRVDSCMENERNWTVKRQDQDFHTLKIKLVEFHGENEICDSPLPSRRSTTPLEMKRQKYEDFLQKLLQKPSLRGSDLLYTFLTTKENFTLIADTNVPIVSDLENIYQSVAHKLRKERGQHLDTFMNTFLASTETGKSKTSKFECPDIGEEADTGISFEGSLFKRKQKKNDIFKNIFDIDIPETIVYTPISFIPTDIIQCASYLLSDIFKAPYSILKLFNSICAVGHLAVEGLCRFYIERELKSALSEHTLAHLINLLQDILFHQKFISPTKAELEERKLNAFKNIAKINRSFITQWCGLELNEGLLKILEILQYPQLNKQLTFALLDLIAVEFFPDLSKTEKLFC